MINIFRHQISIYMLLYIYIIYTTCILDTELYIITNNYIYYYHCTSPQKGFFVDHPFISAPAIATYLPHLLRGCLLALELSG